jgi:hypothetical protein
MQIAVLVFSTKQGTRQSRSPSLRSSGRNTVNFKELNQLKKFYSVTKNGLKRLQNNTLELIRLLEIYSEREALG